MKHVLATAVVLAAVLTLTGCSQGVSPAPTSSAKPGVAMSKAQTEAMADGAVTQDEYEAGFRRYSECVSAAGYTITRGETVNDEIQFSVPAAAGKADQKCYQKEFAQIDAAWQTAHIDTSYTAQVLRDCLVNHKIQPKQHFLDMEAQVEKARISFDECQSEEDRKSSPPAQGQ